MLRHLGLWRVSGPQHGGRRAGYLRPGVPGGSQEDPHGVPLFAERDRSPVHLSYGVSWTCGLWAFECAQSTEVRGLNLQAWEPPASFQAGLACISPLRWTCTGGQGYFARRQKLCSLIPVFLFLFIGTHMFRVAKTWKGLVCPQWSPPQVDILCVTIIKA